MPQESWMMVKDGPHSLATKSTYLKDLTVSQICSWTDHLTIMEIFVGISLIIKYFLIRILQNQWQREPTIWMGHRLLRRKTPRARFQILLKYYFLKRFTRPVERWWCQEKLARMDWSKRSKWLQIDRNFHRGFSSPHRPPWAQRHGPANAQRRASHRNHLHQEMDKRVPRCFAE